MDGWCPSEADKTIKYNLLCRRATFVIISFCMGEEKKIRGHPKWSALMLQSDTGDDEEEEEGVCFMQSNQ